MVILLIFLIQVKSDCCLNCTSPSSTECLECEPGYYMSNFTCVSICGYGFFVNDTLCSRSTGSNTFIQTDFSQIYLYNVTTAGDFKTSNNLALIEPGNMVPTFDRGFYSDEISNLLGKSSWVPNTELTIKLVFRPLVPDGIIFQAFNTLNESFITLSLVSGYLQLEVLTISQVTQLTELQTLTNQNLSQSAGSWFIVKVLFGQVSSTLVRLDLELPQGKIQVYLSDSEMKITEMKNWVLGDINNNCTLKGFYYSISVTNRLLGGIGSVSPPICSVFYFKNYTDNLCYSCPDCNSRLTCVDDTICSLCYSNQCSSCAGFRFGVCDSCSNSETAPYCCPYLCRQCDDLSSCIKCQNGVYMYEGICINYAMYLTTVMSYTPLISTQFDSGFKGTYGGFMTGESTVKYQFFYSPEKIDPIPAKQRGLYFNGTSYLRNYINLNFHPVFSVNLVFKPSSSGNMTILNVGGMFLFQPFLNSFVSYLQTEDSTRTLYFADQIAEYQDWVSLSVSVSYTYPYSTFSVYKDNVLILTKSVTGIFRQINTLIYLAYNPPSLQPYGSNFIGFLYSYTYWNSPVSDFSQYAAPPVCLLESERNCLSTCEMYELLNSTTGSCTNCSESCTLGCIKENSCSICQDRLCFICDDFYNNCTSCITNAYKSGETCACVSNSIDFNDTCDLCDASCSSCETLLVNGCSGCSNTSELLSGGVCYTRCPDGFELIANECQYTDGIVLNLSFYEQYSFATVGNVTIGSSANEQIDSNDPVPDPYRGYYFTLDKYMEKLQALIYYEFSLSLWVKVYAEGDVLTHGNFSIQSSSGLIYSTVPLNSGAFSILSTNLSQEWTHIVIELDCNSNNISTHSLYKSFVLVDSFTFPENVFFIDSVQSIVIGGYSSFTGFIWMLSLNNSAPAVITSTLDLCSYNCSACTIEKICLSDCEFQRPADNCSDYCSPACLNCYTSSQCQRCQPDGILTNGTCGCPINFIWTDSFDQCYFPCFDSCLTCDTKLTGTCYSCKEGYHLISNACVFCPAGYNDASCTKERELSFDLILNEILGIVVDKASGIQGTTGKTSQFYPDYEVNDPVFALYRGFYFDDSFIVFSDEIVLFPPEFTVELWFLPSSPDGVIFSKSIKANCLFEVSLDSFSLKFRFNTYSYGVLEYINTDLVSSTEWNVVQIFVKNLQNINFQVSSCVNSGPVQFHQSIEMSYVNDLYSGFLIGSGSGKDSEPYKGFIYELKIFNVFIENLYSVCEGCLVCSSLNECLPNCSISSYWAGGEYYNCQACDPGCLDGCRDSRESCNLCLDDLCKTCSDPGTCSECQSNSTLNSQGLCECLQGFTNQSYYCEYCDIGYVAANDCVHCEEACVICDSSGCLNCTEHAELVNGRCTCVLGYNYVNSICNFVNFTVAVSVSLENFIYLDFSEGLEKSLEKSDLTLFIGDKNVKFKLSQYTDTRYAIDPRIDFDVDNSSIATINFLRLVVSKNNGLLGMNSTEFVMNEYSVPAPNAIMQAFKSFSRKFTSYATYGVTTSAIFNPTPASLWSFINSIQMLVYLYLFEINLHNRVSGYLIGLKKYNLFPNFFDYMDLSYGKPHQFSKAEKIGFLTNSVLMNTGQWISCFLFFIVLYYLFHWTCLILKNTRFEQSWIRNFLDNKCKGYRYGFFLRFWIQAYIEITVGCYISFYSIDVKTVDQALNLYFSLLLSFFIILTPFVSFSLGFIKKNETSPQTTNQELKLWASLFYEFKEDEGAFRNQFYTIFFLRRFFFISIIFIFHDYPMIQLCIAEILMISMFLFILFKRPFNEPALNYANLTTELTLSIIIPISGTYSFSLSSGVKDIIDIILIVLINTIIFSQFAGSIFIFVKTIRIKLRNRKREKVGNDEEKGKFNIQVQNIDAGDGNDMVFYSNQLNNSPAFSSVGSVLSEIDDKENKLKGLVGLKGGFVSERGFDLKIESQPNVEKHFLGEEFKDNERSFNRGSSL